MGNQSSEDSNSIKDNVAKPKKDFCRGLQLEQGKMLLNQLISARDGNPGMEWKCKRPTSTGQPRQERCSKGRTDALKDVMGVEGSFKNEWDFLYKRTARRLATLWQLLLEACGFVDQQEVARMRASKEKKESISDWWSEDLRLECEAGTEGQSGEGRSEGGPLLTNDQPGGDENKATNWNETTSRGRSRTKTPKEKNEA